MKIKEIYICNECGSEFLKWSGKCTSCGCWNSLEQQIQNNIKSKSIKLSNIVNSSQPFLIKDINIENEKRYDTGISELNRVLGGGIVKGSLILLGGSPGIGKSTLLLQICKFLNYNLKILYISGEESINQIKLRADRLCINNENLYIISESNIEIIDTIIEKNKPDVVIIDSIQTINLSSISSVSGSVSQVRECTNFLMSIAKTNNIPIILVGHVNKDGGIAGPKVLEHIVDVVMYFEGDRSLSYRMLRCIKNRYGSTNEIGIFEMTDKGLSGISNPSMMLLDGKPNNVPGSCVTCIIEGSRPIMVEIQALVTKTTFGNPRRTTAGFDYNRMSLIIAILEKRAGYFFGNLDVYINVVGGLKLDDPACDLAVAFSIISSLLDRIVPDNYIFLGEIGLAGEIRSVSNIEKRIKESFNLGFDKCVIPLYMSKSVSKLNISNKNLMFVDNINHISKLF